MTSTKLGHYSAFRRAYRRGVACASANFFRQSRHKQSAPSAGIGKRFSSCAHQHGPAGLQLKKVPHDEQASSRPLGNSFLFFMNLRAFLPCF
jgi:hypothetical protein